MSILANRVLRKEDPTADLNASVAFRQHLAPVLVGRALEEAGT